MPLPTTHANNDPGHTAAHNATNTQVNTNTSTITANEAALATKYGVSALSSASGVVGDGVADDTAALKALIANNTYIYLPWTRGGYRITGPLYDAPIATRKVIVGQAYTGPLYSPVDYGTRIWVDDTTVWDPTKYVLHFTGQGDPASSSTLLPGVTMKDLRIAGTEGGASLQTSMNGLMFDRCRDVALTNVYFNKVQGCCLDFRSTWDSVFVNIKAMKSGDGSTRTITDVSTTNASNQITSSSLTAADEGATATGTGIPAGARLLSVSGTTGYLSANATATNTGVSVSVVRNVQVVRCLPYSATADASQADTNTLTFFSLHIEEHYAGPVLLGRQTRRCKFFGGKNHGQANKTNMSREPHFRLESAYANIFSGVQFSKAGRHHLELDAHIDPVTLAADAQWSDANMVSASYFDSAGSGLGAVVTDGAAIRIIKGNRNTFGQCEFEDNDLNVVVDSGNTGNVVAFSPLGLSGVQADLTNKFTGPLTYLYVDPTTQALSVRDINGHLTPLVDVTTGAVAGVAAAQAAAIAAGDARLQAALYLTPSRLESFGRDLIQANASTIVSGVVYFVFVDAPWDATAPVSTLGLVTASTSPSGLTLCRLGRYTRDGSNNLTLEAFTADFKASMATATDFTGTLALASGATLNGVTCPSTITWTRGAKYALAYVYTGATHPGIRTATSANASVISRSPVMAMSLAAQADLPASATFASLATTAIRPYLTAGA